MRQHGFGRTCGYDSSARRQINPDNVSKVTQAQVEAKAKELGLTLWRDGQMWCWWDGKGWHNGYQTNYLMLQGMVRGLPGYDPSHPPEPPGRA